MTVVNANNFSIGVDTTHAEPTSGGVAGPALLITCDTLSVPTLPDYFQNNNWDRVIYYAVGKNALQNFGAACAGCTLLPLMLTLTRRSKRIRGRRHYWLDERQPAGRQLGDYIDTDAGNRDANDTFFTPASKALDRDRLFTIADVVPPASCKPNAGGADR